MTPQEVTQIINTSLAEEFELDPELMQPQALLKDDLGLDSLDGVDMVIVLEQAFHFKIGKDPDLSGIRTLQDVYDFVLSKRQPE
ncbi:acyl carrier protein [Desulfovibrio inopinatus]|uniref:acyl carrier protein n=1 Tax=Desulfovibrio inopinatus TaxID=102109 RepID=UPI00040F9E98|nr:phosphopantetheine-binding protein [Desulfovibrio inopinatus]